jgi:beta-lactamase regulating signal transducer with metallopeptidase domain
MMALIWFNIFVLLGSLLQRKLCLFLHYNFYPILFLIFLSLIRLVAPVETPFTVVIQSWVVFPAIQNAMKTEIAFTESSSLTVFGILTLISSIIAVVLLIRLLRTYRRGFKVVNSCPQTEDARLLGIMDGIVRETKPGQSYRLCVFEENIVPSICGLWKPTIMLPASLLAMTDEDIRYILSHEWRHYREKDLWVKFFIEVICCITWWNPVVYLLKKDIDQTFELKCDLKTTIPLSEGDRLDYLSTLLKLARMQWQSEKQQPAAIHFTGRSSEGATMVANARQRFQTVLQYEKRNRKIEVACIACLLMLFLMSFRFVVQPCFAPPMDDFVELADVNMDSIGVVKPTPENAYIVAKEDGAYWLYINNQYSRTLLFEETFNETHKHLPVIKEKKG